MVESLPGDQTVMSISRDQRVDLCPEIREGSVHRDQRVMSFPRDQWVGSLRRDQRVRSVP